MSIVYKLFLRTFLKGSFVFQLTGSNVPIEEVLIFNGLEIRDTSNHLSGYIDVTKYKKIMVEAYSSHDQDVNLQLMANGGNVQWFDGASWVSGYDSDKKITMDSAVAGRRYNLNSFWPDMLDRPLKEVQILAKCDTAPTSGNLTIRVLGVLN